MKKSLEFKMLAIVATILIVGVVSASVMTALVQKATLYSATTLGAEKSTNIILG